jgi:fructose-1,6-bisphosphatase/inositol monophosphatase family enzyme
MTTLRTNSSSSSGSSSSTTWGTVVATVCAVSVVTASTVFVRRSLHKKNTTNRKEEEEEKVPSSPSVPLPSSSSTTPAWTQIPPELQQDHPYVPELKLAVELALQAGSNMISHCETRGTVQAPPNSEEALGIATKTSAVDFCTHIDVQNETLIMKGIQQTFPSHHIIGEETTGTSQVEPLTWEPTWIIDPIDGTTNFASGLPLTCVSIGFCVQGRPVMGVVYAPMTQELYMTVRGYGAYRNTVKLSFLSNSSNSTQLHNAVVNFEFGYARHSHDISTMVGAVQRILEHGCRTTRSLGSGVLDLCYVATGRIDVVYAGIATEGWKPWDYCAGMLIVLESGGVIESLQKQTKNENENENENDTPADEYDIYSSSVICAVNQQLLEECRTLVCGGDDDGNGSLP